MDGFYTKEEASTILGVSLRQINYYMSRGTLRRLLQGNKAWIPREDVQTLYDNLQKGLPPGQEEVKGLFQRVDDLEKEVQVLKLGLGFGSKVKERGETELLLLRQSILDMLAKDQWTIKQMSDYADELIESYSHGMKQRLVMAAALIHRPRTIIVDEPMVGLDPRGAKLVKRIFRELCDHGITIFMSIHTLEIAEEMCDRIGIIQQGRLIAVGTMDELKEQIGGSDGRLESIFFKLTGDEDMQEVISALRL